MSQLWLLLSTLSAALAAVVLWRGLRPPPDFAPVQQRHGHRADIRESLTTEQALYPYLLDVLRVLAYPMSSARLETTRTGLDDKLRKAGDLLGLEPAEFLGLCLVCSVGTAAMLGWSVSLVALGWAVPAIIIGAGMGYVMPLLYLEDLVARRMREIHKELPYVLDTLAISLTAGLSFPQSLRRLLARREGRDSVLLQELKVVHLQMEMGMSLEDSFDELKDRVPSNFVADVANAVRQSQSLGAPLQQVFRLQSDAIRLKRTHRAEKLAGEAPVKLLLPLSFIFFGILILVLGPSMIQLIRGEVF